MIEQKYADLFARGDQVPLEVADREIVLTYVLKILDEAGLLNTLAFKGGTCLRKCIYGKETRFSLDLDFTVTDDKTADDVILGIVSSFNKPAYGITFQVHPKDFYVGEDGLSCGASVGYRHAWNQGHFKLEISLREKPSLSLVRLPLQPQGYMRHLEFPTFTIPCFQFEELLAEKVRATSQRARSRDLYDLFKAGERVLNSNLVRMLAVIKCWNVRAAFDPKQLLEKMRSAKYDWEDLRQLIRRREKLAPERLVASCQERYKFLLELTEDEKRLISDARRHRLKDLPARLLKQHG